MISANAKVLVTLNTDRVITVRLPQGIAVVRDQVKPNIQVVTIGQQGPVGTVSEEVLATAAEAKALAVAASEVTQSTAILLDSVIISITNGFNFQAGELSA